MRQEHRREHRACEAPARVEDRRVLRRSFDAPVAGVVFSLAVTVVLAVCLVVLGRVADDVGEREAVV